MKPEQLTAGKALSEKIKHALSPIKKMNKLEITGSFRVVIGNPSNDHYNACFKLKRDQLETIKDLVMSMAERNLKELEYDFDAL